MKSFKKISLLVFLIALLAISNSMAYKKVQVFIPETPEIDLLGVHKIAVLDFKASYPIDREIGKLLSDKMIEFFLMEDRGIHAVPGGFFKSPKNGRTFIDGLSTRCFSVVERSRIEAVIDEQQMSDMGLITDNQAAQIGQLVGVEVMLYGDLTTTKNDKKSLETRTRNKKKYTITCITREVTISAGIRIVDTKTGEIIGTKRLTKKATDKQCGSSRSKLKDVSELASYCVNAMAWDFVNIINPWYGYNSYELAKIKNKEFKKEADKAAGYAKNLELDKAYAIYKKLYDSDTYNPKFLYNMGVLYEITGDFHTAQEMYDGAAMLTDDKLYNKASDRIARRVQLIEFYASQAMTITPFDFVSAAENKSLFAQRITIKGSSKQRFEIYSDPSKSSSVVVKVPGKVQFEVIEATGDWYLIKLLGGKQGYVHKNNTEA